MSIYPSTYLQRPHYLILVGQPAWPLPGGQAVGGLELGAADPEHHVVVDAHILRSLGRLKGCSRQWRACRGDRQTYSR
jgi:hypothetical protein